MRFLASAALLWVALPGCGLTLDYDPPMDAGGGGLDAASPDAPTPRCAVDLDCDDHDACTGIEQCIAGSCSPGQAVDCDDDDVCTGEERCDPETGACQAGEPLICGDDGDLCNGDELCDPMMGCAHGAPLFCDDGIDCTVDDCEPTLGCTAAPVDTRCTDGEGGLCDVEVGCTYDTCEDSWCNGDDPCLPSHCEGNTCVRAPVLCTGDQECCGGECVALGCDDGNECTVDGCAPGTGCRNAPTLGRCDDDDLCTDEGFCREGECQPGPLRDCRVMDPCHVGMCNVDTGECEVAPTSGPRCSDGDACTGGDTCMEGVCVPTAIPMCDDAEDCTVDSCDSVSGCRFVAMPDGNGCNVGGLPGTCTSGVCREVTACGAGTADCDADGDCECLGRCAPGPGGMLRCVLTSLDCAVTGCLLRQMCCLDPRSSDSGTCVPEDCADCCQPAAS
jgi:hypothetical protein